MKHIEYIHIDDKHVHILKKNVKTSTGIVCTQSDHNVIKTKLNISWSQSESSVMEVFKYKDKEAQAKFKYETTNTDKLSDIIVVTKKFRKRL